MGKKWVGKNVRRKEAWDKVTGKSLYIDDINLPDMWFGLTIRHPGPRGRIKRIEFQAGVPWDEITVVQAKDIPGVNHVALITNDQPFLAQDFINHPEEAVCLLAHPDREMLLKAAGKVKIHWDPLPAVLTIDESLNQKTVIWGQDNILKSYLMEKGNTDEAFQKAHMIIEQTYETGAQEQLYIEPNGVVAHATKDGVTVWGSMQCPYYVQKALMPLFGLPPEKVRIIQTETGGGFGGKEEYPSMIAGHAALLSLKAGHPIKLVYDRAEDMVATTKRHPSRTRHRTAVDKEGRLLAMDIDFVIDGGAYVTLSPVVLSRGTIHAAGPYYCENVRVKARAVATNTVPHGAFRGFGAPQSLFALERHFDVIAKKLNLTPEEFRRRNFLKPGQMTATSQVIQEKIDLSKLLDRALKDTDFKKCRQKFKKENQKSRGIKKGIGLACFMHGAGFTGSGESYLASVIGIEALPSGRFRVLSASTEIGQGTNTIFSQMAADSLGVSYDDIEVSQPDTAFVPNSGPTVASRTCMIVGGLLEKACERLKNTVRDAGFTGDFKKAVAGYLKKVGPLKSYAQYEQPKGIFWDDKLYRGDAYGAFAWAVYVAKVSVDLTTFEIKLDDFYALQDVGKVIHPLLAKGQIEGGVAQGIGYSLYEKVVYKKGRMMNGQMTNYIMPTSSDLPKIRVAFLRPSKNSPKGIGELPMDGPGPAIMNAVADAVGLEPLSIPFLPENMQELLG